MRTESDTPPAEAPRPEAPRVTARESVATLLRTGRITVLGRIPEASNDTYLVVVAEDVDESVPGPAPRAVRAVYKPRAGEAPLHDFPYGTLADREVAAHVLSAVLDLDVVPPTVLRTDAPRGEGSLQAYVEQVPIDDEPDPDTAPEAPRTPATDTSVGEGEGASAAEDDFAAAEGRDLVSLFPASALGPGGPFVPGPDGVPPWAPVVSGTTEDGTPVYVAHRTGERMRRLAFFDLLANNADRKGSHVLYGQYSFEPGDSPDVWGIDNGLSFHPEPKVRSVLWGFAGTPFDEVETAALRRVVEDPSVLDALREVLDDPLGLASLQARAAGMLAAGEFPHPPEDRYPLPWPPL
ncbi:phosphatidylinositol kinase [Brevibacterium litoralis]|uniref:phosphatidylinositol kinase n=1 Tax=Brevibacterium litoralis TaxID=3138935 RepID=UPI0032EDB288